MKLEILFVVFGPSCLGLLTLILSAMFCKKTPWMIAACLAAVALHLLSVLLMAMLIGMGEAWSGQSPAHEYPRHYCIGGLIVFPFAWFLARRYRSAHKSQPRHQIR